MRNVIQFLSVTALVALSTPVLAGGGGVDPVPIPEPSTLAIIAGGLVAAALIRSRMRK
jgi:hypothetical protein